VVTYADVPLLTTETLAEADRGASRRGLRRHGADHPARDPAGLAGSSAPPTDRWPRSWRSVTPAPTSVPFRGQLGIYVFDASC
jgi:hypothetical protein